MIRINQYSNIGSFTAAAGDFLAQREAEHNLLLGICTALKTYPERYPDAYLAAAVDQGKVVAAALMTPPRNVVLSISDTPGTAELFANDLHASRRSAPSVAGPMPDSEEFVRRWQALTRQGYAVVLRMRIYRLDSVKPVSGAHGKLRRAERADKDILIQWVEGFRHDALRDIPQPTPAEELVEGYLTSKIAGLVVWEEGKPVSMAAYQGPTPNGIRVGLVYTPPDQRMNQWC